MGTTTKTIRLTKFKNAFLPVVTHSLSLIHLVMESAVVMVAVHTLLRWMESWLHKEVTLGHLRVLSLVMRVVPLLPQLEVLSTLKTACSSRQILSILQIRFATPIRQLQQLIVHANALDSKIKHFASFRFYVNSYIELITPEVMYEQLRGRNILVLS